MEGSRLVAKQKPKLNPIGDVLSPETAFIQASNILDVAAEMAVEQRDIEGLSKIAAVYMEIASRLMVVQEDGEEEDDDEDYTTNPIGFAPVVMTVKEVEDKDE